MEVSDSDLMSPPSLHQKSKSNFNKSMSSFTRTNPPTPEELKDAIDKSKEYLKINKNISCFYLLNRILRNLQDNEIDIHSRFQLYRSYLECIQRIVNRIFLKHPEKNEKQANKLHTLLQRGFVSLEDWSQYIIAYINEYKEKFTNKQSEKIIQEVLDNLSPLLITERDMIFDVKVQEEIKLEEKKDLSPEKKEQKKKEELMLASLMNKGSIRNMLPKFKYRTLYGEEKTNFIKFDYYFAKFLHTFFQISFLFAYYQKRRKNLPLAVLVLLKLSECFVFINDFFQKDVPMLDIFIKIRMVLASIYWENGMIKETLSVYGDLIEFHRRQFSTIMGKEIIFRKTETMHKFKRKLSNCVQKMTLNFILQSVLYEGMDIYERSVECLNFALWLSSSYLNEKDEIYRLALGFSIESHKKYSGILQEQGEITKVINIYLEKLYDKFPELKPIEKTEENQFSILQESDAILYEKFRKKLEGFEYIYVKSFSESPSLDLLNSNIKHNKTILYEPNPQNEKLAQKTQDKTNLFEVSLEPSYREQSLTSKRLSALGKLSTNLKSNRNEMSLDLSREMIRTGKIREKTFSSHSVTNRKKRGKEVEEFPEKSTLLTTTKYFKTSEEIRKIVDERHRKNASNELNKAKTAEMHNLDDFFAKKIDQILLKKCQNRGMNDVQETFIDYLKDEDFDKKEFDFSKMMLRHKKSYSMGKIKSEFLISREEKDQLNTLHPRREIRREIKDLLTKNNIIEKIDRTKSAQEDEKASNFCSKLCQRSSVVTGGLFRTSYTNEMTSSIHRLQTSQMKNSQMNPAMMNSLMKDSVKGEDGKAKLQNLIMKHRVTFEFKKMIEMQRKESIEGKGVLKNAHRASKSVGKKDEGKETLERIHKNTKEMIQRMAENMTKDMENVERMIKEIKGNPHDEEQLKLKKEKELNAKMSHIVKKNWELSKSLKNISIKREIFENFQNQLNIMASNKMMKQSNVIHPVPITVNNKIY